MGDIIKTAQCRFCGQMVQIETDKELTQPQAEEQATMTCNCTEAVEYQKEKQRKEKAMMNVSAFLERTQHRTRDAVRALSTS